MSFVQFLSDKDFSLPIWEIAILLLVMSVCILSGKHKSGLLTAYLFVFYWIFMFNRAHILELMGDTNWSVSLFSILGVVVAIIAIVGFFIKTDD